jgi:excisionase family DNA binding protein
MHSALQGEGEKMLDEDDEDLITVTEAARWTGLNQSTLQRQVKAGKIRSRAGGRVRLSECLGDRAANVRQRSPRTPGSRSTGMLPLAVAAAMKQGYLSQLRLLRLLDAVPTVATALGVDQAALERELAKHIAPLAGGE